MADIERLPVGDSKELLLRRHTGARKLVSTRLARALATCCKFDTIDQHALRLARSGTAASEGQDPVGIVNALIAEGILVSEAEIVSLAKRIVAGQPETAEPIRSINFVTRDRVECFRATAVTYAENIRRFGRDARIAVLDDSRDAATRAQYRRAIKEIQEAYGIPTQYVGAEEKNQLLRRLVGEGGVPEAVARFALFGDAAAGGTWGANRNAFLLHTAGEVALSVDDDIPCRIAPAPERKPGLRLSSEHDPCEYWFYPTRDQALEGLRFEERDILSIHEELLGKRLAACIAQNSNIQWDDNADIVALALNPEHARVLVTVAGFAGDSGVQSHRVFALKGPSRQRLESSPDTYHVALQSSEIVKVVDSSTISSGRTCSAGCLGVDNRQVLPPFMPAGRGSDGVFGFTLRAATAGGSLGHLPWALPHMPPGSRRLEQGELWRDAGRIRISDVLKTLIVGCAPGSSDVSSGLRLIADTLSSAASLNSRSFEALVRAEYCRQVSKTLLSLEYMMQVSSDAADHWKGDLRKYVQFLRNSLAARDSLVITDAGCPEESFEILRKRIAQFGDLLAWWPAMVSVTRHRTAGV